MKPLPSRVRGIGLALLAVASGFGLALTQAGTIAYWPFEPGDPGADASGNGHSLQLNHVATSAEVAADAPGAGSAVFDGATSFAQTVAALDLSSHSALTLEFFAQSTQTSLGMICEHGPDIAGVPGAFYCDFNENGESFRVTEYSSAGFNYAFGAAPVRDGQWHHYAVTLDNRGPNVAFNLYVDGNRLTPGTRVEGASAPGISDFFNLGARNGSLFFYQGRLDEVRLSDRLLDPASFLRNPYANVTFGITQSPANLEVREGEAAVFTVTAAVTNAPAGVLEYQWLRDGVEIPGAMEASYRLVPTYANDHQARFTVRLSAAGIHLAHTILSDPATLTVLRDTTAPTAQATYAPAVNFVTVTFDSPLDPTTAGDAARYRLNGGATVDGAQLVADSGTVVLNVTGLTSPTYTLTFEGIADDHGNPGTGTVVGTNRAGLTLADLGSVTLPGYVLATNALQSVVAATGTDIWGGADGFTFLSTNLTGDFDLRVRVENLSGSVNANTRGGLMVREDTTPGSRNIAALTYANAGNWVVTARTTVDGPTTIPGYPGAGLIARTSPYPNAWLRIVRSGSTFYTYSSTNNLDWLSLDGGGITPAEPFAADLLVGLASSQISVTSPPDSPHAFFTYSGFQNYVATEGTIVVTKQPTSLTVLEHRPATFTVEATLPGGDPTILRYQWRTNGVDLPQATQPTFTLAAPGRALNGTQVRCIISAGPNLAPVATDPVILTVTPDTTAPVVLSASASAVAPTTVVVVWDELLDETSAQDASRYSLDGGFGVWSATLQPDGRTVILGTDGVRSPQFQLTCTDLADLAGNRGTSTVTGTLHNQGLALAEIQGGYPTTATVVGSTPTGLTIQSQFGDIWGAADSCTFIYQPLTHDFDVRVHLVGMAVPSGWARGGLMARVSVDADSANLMVGSYREGSATYVWTARARAGEATTYGTAPQAPTFPHVWSRIQRVGSTFRAYHSPDGYVWTRFGEITDLEAPDVMLVGLAFSTCALNDPLIGVVQFDQFGPITSPPQLSIALADLQVVVRWPASAGGFQLQQTPELGSGAPWTVVTETPTRVGDALEVVLPIGTPRFYRLAQ